MADVISSSSDFKIDISTQIEDHFVGFNLLNNLNLSSSQLSNNSVVVDDSIQVVNIPDLTTFVVGGTSNESGELTSAYPGKIQAIYFGKGLTQEQYQSLNADLVKLVSTVDESDHNEPTQLDPDPDINRILYKVLYSRGYDPSEPSSTYVNNSPEDILNSPLHDDIKMMVDQLKSTNTWDKLKVLYLPVFKDADVNKINFKSPDQHNISSWIGATQQTSDTCPGKTVNVSLNLHFSGGLITSTVVPTPYASFSSDSIQYSHRSPVRQWSDQTGHGHHLVSVPSTHHTIDRDNKDPIFLKHGGRNQYESKPAVHIGGWAGQSLRLTTTSLTSDTIKHVFVCYRTVDWAADGTLLSLKNHHGGGTTDSMSITTSSVSSGCSTSLPSGFKSYTINGEQRDTFYVKPYTYQGVNYNDDVVIPDNSVQSDPMFQSGCRIVHLAPNTTSGAVTFDGFSLGGLPLDDQNTCADAELFDVIIYDQDLTDEQVKYVHSYLAMKHDVHLTDDYSEANKHVTHNASHSINIPTGSNNTPTTPFKLSDIISQNGFVGCIKAGVETCQTQAYDFSNNTVSLGPATPGVNNRTGNGLNFLQFNGSSVELYLAPDTNSSSSFSRPSDIGGHLHMMSDRVLDADFCSTSGTASADLYSCFFVGDQLLNQQDISSFIQSHRHIMSNRGGSTANDTSYSTDPDANAYVSRVISELNLEPSQAFGDPRILSAINFINRGKTAGWWNKITAAYFPVWKNVNLNNLNIKNPTQLTAVDQTNVDHYSGLYVQTTGVVDENNNIQPMWEIPLTVEQLHTKSCEDFDSDDWSTVKFHHTVHYKDRPEDPSPGRPVATSWGPPTSWEYDVSTIQAGVHVARWELGPHNGICPYGKSSGGGLVQTAIKVFDPGLIEAFSEAWPRITRMYIHKWWLPNAGYILTNGRVRMGPYYVCTDFTPRVETGTPTYSGDPDTYWIMYFYGPKDCMDFVYATGWGSSPNYLAVNIDAGTGSLLEFNSDAGLAIPTVSSSTISIGPGAYGSQIYHGPDSCAISDDGSFKYKRNGVYLESIQGVGDSVMRWDDQQVVKTRNCTTSNVSAPTTPLSYTPGGGHTNVQVDFIALGLAFDNSTESLMIDDYVAAIQELTSGLVDTIDETGSDVITSSSNSINIHAVNALSSSDQTVMLFSSKGDLSIHGDSVPESLSTTTQPFTGVWSDDRLWNFNQNDLTTDINPGDFSVNFGTAVRRTTGWPVDGTEYISKDLYKIPPGRTPFIRGRNSGAIRRTTWGHAGSVHNDNPSSGTTEDRLLKFKIISDEPWKGLFIGGGSPPWRINDCVTTGVGEYDVMYPGRNGASDSYNWFRNSELGEDSDDLFMNMSNDIDFIQGEPIDIMYIEGRSTDSYDNYKDQLIDSTPGQNNIQFYNGKYVVSEVTDLSTSLSDGAVFDSGTTHGGPNQPTTSGQSKPLQAWMKIEMAPIETINIGPTNQHDLILTGISVDSREWSNRFFVGGADVYGYKLNVDHDDNMYVSGTYQGHMVVNYNLDKNETYSKVLNSTGAAGESVDVNSDDYSQAFVTKHDPETGGVITCLSTSGECYNIGGGAIGDSHGNIFLTGKLAGKASFKNDHGVYKSVIRGVDTGARSNGFGFLAKASMNDLQVDQYVKYKPLDYTWDWVVYVDAPTHALSGDRMLVDVVVDLEDNVYTIGDFTGPTEIGVSGGAKMNDNNSFKFEPGYKWVDNGSSNIFIGRWSSTGLCGWSNVYAADSVSRESSHLKCYDNKLFFSAVGQSVSIDSNDLSGLIVGGINRSNGSTRWVKSFHADNITCNSLTISDTGSILITGECSSLITSPDISIGKNPDDLVDISGYSIMIQGDGVTASITYMHGDSVTVSGTSQSVNTGKGSTYGVVVNQVDITSGDQSATISAGVNNLDKYCIYKLNHDL